MILRTCKSCGKQFATSNKSKLFCITKCRSAYNNEKLKANRKLEVEGDIFKWEKFNGCVIS